MLKKMPKKFDNTWIATSELAYVYQEKWVNATPKERAELLVSILKDNELQNKRRSTKQNK